jgi:O-antigen ligase
MLDRARRIALWLAIASLVVPGIKGWDLAIGALSLGRFQPFKFFFMAWLGFQAAWLRYPEHRHGPTIAKREVLHGQRRAAAVAAIGIGLFLIGLAVGLLSQGGGPIGWNILLSLVLSALATLATAADRAFPVGTTRSALAFAAVALLLFAGLERIASSTPWVMALLAAVRDGELVTYQTGSSLTPSALAELCVRALPITLIGTRARDRMSSVLLVFLALSTLTRGALLALGVMALAWFFRSENRRFLRPAAALGIALTAGLVLWMGPQRVYGRYFGWLINAGGDRSGYSEAALGSANERIRLARAAIIAWRAHPLTGLGLDGLAHRLREGLPPLTEASRVTPALHAHNLYLETAAAGGSPALIGLLLLMGAVVWASFRPMFQPGLGLYLLGVATCMCFDARIYVSWLAITFLWFGAIAWQAGRPRLGEVGQ